jgi:hypothetical protein
VPPGRYRIAVIAGDEIAMDVLLAGGLRTPRSEPLA